MTRASAHAIQLLRDLSEVAERLAGRNVVVGSLSSYWSAFGSWVIEASDGNAVDRTGAAIKSGDYGSAGPDVVRVSWDGRDHVLDISVVHTTVISMDYGSSEPLPSQEFASSTEALRYAERFILERLGTAET